MARSKSGSSGGVQRRSSSGTAQARQRRSRSGGRAAGRRSSSGGGAAAAAEQQRRSSSGGGAAAAAEQQRRRSSGGGAAAAAGQQRQGPDAAATRRAGSSGGAAARGVGSVSSDDRPGPRGWRARAASLARCTRAAAAGSAGSQEEAKPTAPSSFYCPVSMELMADPVMVATGHTYDRQCIEKWLAQGNRTCPVTGMRLRHLELTPNYALRTAIQGEAGSTHPTVTRTSRATSSRCGPGRVRGGAAG
ncbi:U-box domain-containing protein 10 [Tetrabaena socialis]|uniref:RING-type E3 ubiquitin transferase n=1 Tax=Tetrabaena socialis TaxID=47790 RepID=A0A2J7ZRW4_9CHLO|nr:U-box domain-containing protein 10 [Tetrabaena socialis]|eukprot:PNH03017.1 U-box domain-containing protein 10 [Tetrabaena socialis]